MAAPPRPPADPVAFAHAWFVRAGDAVFGPYPEARLRAFAAEGRVTAATLASPFAEGPWSPMGDTPDLAPLLVVEPPAKPLQPAATPLDRPRAASVEATATKAPPPSPPSASPFAAEPAPNHGSASLPPTAGGVRTLLVFGELSGVSTEHFQAALAAHGRCVEMRPGLWLLAGEAAPAAIRNALSRRLGAHDALVVVEAGLKDAAWFNLDADVDRRLRRLWGEAGRG